jgi:calcium channel MID1
MTPNLKASKANSWWARRLNANPHLPLKRRWSCLTLIITGLLFCSAVVAQVSISTASLPLTISLPPLNASSPAFDLLITSPSTSTITSLYLTLSICSLGTNTSIIPAALVSTDVSDFDINDNSVSDRLSGGVERANRKAKGRDVWALSWDKGFANWTYVDDTGVGEIGMRIGFADGQEVSDGNVVIQLGAGVDGMSSQS